MRNHFPLLLLTLFVTTWFTVGCASNNGLEQYNQRMYAVNKKIDQYTLKPLSQGYQKITPDPVERRVSHFFGNLGEINTFANSLLQGKFKNAGLSSSRFVWNTTLGLGGLFDVATAMGISADKEDFGQTLRAWGVPAGPYLVLPILGPSTITDTVGLIGDYGIDPINRYQWNDYRVETGVNVLKRIDQRAGLLNTEKVLASSTINEYEFVKSAYLQRRASLTRDGAPDPQSEDAFDAFFDEE
ncbi:MlaA family lipoprotein [Ostreibacterium oceani]|uniref:VacJ family lipoprotein n=1 Tax=Ostreibacterium oceani TaxID=2654998 RepID=A0A6N7EUW0_9GAMM|nr:VacJ family lipoprotein [Ostreibacterium oceani]MPV86564.1 VacJ family lipoprotein [Ostreibacterium oceani]